MPDTANWSYTLNAKIHHTPVAEVYRGYRDSDGVPLVVKVLRDEHPSAVELFRLRQEHALLKSLDLPGVVRALELRPVGHGLALLLADAGEVSLHSLIRAGRLDLRRSLEFAISMTKVVASIHAEGIVHKDLKPQHFMVRPDDPNSVVLLDFGLATRLSRHTQTLTPVSHLEGTLAYIAPEQTGRMNRVVDRRSDLYSLGASLYELFTGRLPFQTTDPLELVHSHIARTPRSPHEIDPTIPQVLSDIVMKLMAKVAEDRYQNALGLLSDLERCLRELSPSGPIQPFPLGEQDLSDELCVPQKLFGRQREGQTLLAAFERASQGAVELLLLSGYSGIGKSVLVAELYRRMARGGQFASGKFGHRVRGIPYAPIVHVCRQLVEALLAEPPETLSERRQALLDALGPNGKLVTDLVPELERVVGTQPDVPVLGPTESQRRLELVLQSFLGVFASGEQPLVIFLDDLQWADPASVRLLEVVLTAPERGHLLVIGAYRDNEVNSAHPLTIALEQLRRAGVPVTELVLGPLGLGDLTELVAETLRSSPELVAPLAEVLFAKTRGNPFFFLQLLGTLHRDHLLRFNLEQRTWQWDLQEVQGALVTDNVVEFMLARLRQLSPTAQSVLRIAACIGHRFDANTLTVVSARSEGELRAGLWEALQQGVIVPLDDKYRYLVETSESSADGSAATLNATYRFLHDRVQQAAYALIDETQKAQVHLGIGRLLLGQSSGHPTDEALFTVVDHLDHAIELVADPAEKAQLMELNLSAGQRARDAAAPSSAIDYLRVALELMGPTRWSSTYDSAFRAHLLTAECEYLVSNVDEALRLLDDIDRFATRTLDRVAARNLKSIVLSTTGNPAAACSLTVETARLLGMDLPAPEDQTAMGAATGAEFGALQAALAGRSIESLAELPPMTDPEQLALMRTLTGGFGAAFQCNQAQFGLIVVKAATLTLRHGTAPSSPSAYVHYGLVHLLATGDAHTGYRFGRLAIELCQSPVHAAFGGTTHFVFSGFLVHWRDHYSVCLEHLRAGLRLCLESGDLEHAAFCAGCDSFTRVFTGENLDEVRSFVPGAVEVAQRTGDVVNLATCQLTRQFIAALQGRTECPGSLDGDGFAESSLAHAPYVVQTFAATAMTMTRYLAGRYREALAAADACSPLPGNYYNIEHATYRALALVELARTAAADERQALLGRVREAAETLGRWAESSPSNCACRHALVRAELAAVENSRLEAMDLYDQAIALAQEHRFTNLEALSNELCAAFHVEHGHSKLARPYVEDAYYCYQRWGASAKLTEIDAKYPQWFEDTGPDRAAIRVADTLRDSQGPTLTSATSGSYPGGTLDLATAIRASQTIVTELVFETVLERLMQALIENAGAQRGFLLLRRGDALRVEAAITVDPDAVQVGLAQDLSSGPDLAGTVVQYVARVQQTLVLADASRDHRFASDPYVARCVPKSILCVPMVHRGALTGVLYLENNLATQAFTPARAELLQFLAAQAAAAIENSRLYGELALASEQLRQANDTLESQVAARTEELRRALGELWAEMDLARKIQTVLLPKEPSLPDYQIAGFMLPTADVGGDYYDVFSSDAGGGWVLIGDVSGHGVTAGLIMMMVQSALRTAALQPSGGLNGLSPASVLSHVNGCLWNNLRQISRDQYMTITALKLEGGRVSYAGLHQDILVYRAATHRVERIETSGVWIGVVDDISPLLEDRTLELEPGDVLFLYTDGLTELSENGQMLGTAGLLAKFQSVVTRTTEPAAIVQGIVGPLTGRDVNDDATVVVVRYSPAHGHPMNA
jgi:predicted ATPase/serine phosphatase RsbU (regulator of sigma subunit)